MSASSEHGSAADLTPSAHRRRPHGVARGYGRPAAPGPGLLGVLCAGGAAL